MSAWRTMKSRSRAVLVGERIELQFGGRKVQALAGHELDPGELAARDTGEKPAMRLADDGALELAVVERDLVADADRVEHARLGAGRLEGHLGKSPAGSRG